jgi:hypothetical protein
MRLTEFTEKLLLYPGNSYGVPYIWVQTYGYDNEEPYGVPGYDEATCDGRDYVSPPGNYYCA